MADLMVRQLKQTHPELVPSRAVNINAIKQANIPLQHKKDLLKLMWQQAGAVAILSIGQRVQEVEYDPIWRAAMRSDSPEVLFDKWRRFEVFAHSQNRVSIEQISENKILLHRYTLEGGTPSAPENLLICGLIIALLEKIGCFGLHCEMACLDNSKFSIRKNGQFQVPDDIDLLSTAEWSIDWQSFTYQLDKESFGSEDGANTLLQSYSAIQNTPIETVVHLLSRDVARAWKVGELARESGLSKRSLQRRLSDVGLSFSHLIRLVRVHEACRLLKESAVAITTVGFCAGFSDSAHFSRDFRASMGMTPTDFRDISR